MSVINGLYYQHLRSSVGFTATGSLFYATLPWHPQSTIDEIRVTNTAGTAFTITNLVIVNSGAHYRNNSTDGKGHIIYRDPTDKNATSNEGFWASYLFNPAIFHENLYDRPFLNILINLSESKTNYPMKITATGKKATSTSYLKADNQGLEVLSDYRVLIGKVQSGAGGTAGTIYDVTGIAKGTGGENSSQFNFNATTDYIYVGSKKKVDHWEFQVGIGLTAPANLLGQYWNGTDWTAFTVIDDTSTGNSDTMKFSGIVEGSGLGSSAWVPVVANFASNAKLPNDPLTVLQNRIIAGGYPIVVLPPNPERYWVRFNLSAVAADGLTTFNRLLPVAETYEAF